MKIDKISFPSGGGNGKGSNQLQTDENEQEVAEKREEKVINSFCSLQKRVGPPDYRKWRRIHGLQLPLHPQQIAGWIILLAVGGASFFVMIPALRPLLRDAVFIVLGTLFGLHILSHLTALLLDPADPELRALKANFSVPEFDRTKHTHVIENGRCHLCNIKTTSPKTKHCSVCNKCIAEFDHHCKWLNHCIGGRNYVPFLICVVSAVAASLVIVGVSVLEIIYYHTDPDSLTVFSSHNGTAQELFLPDSVFLGIVTVLGLLAATTAGLLLHLCLFHCYISILGISTYEYIRNYRQELNDGVQRRLGVGNDYCDNGREVMSNRLETTKNSRNKQFKNCCYYSFSRPPETKEENQEKSYTGFKSLISRLGYCLRLGRPPKRKLLKRQSTDPEFVDKIIKPFLITLNDEKNAETMMSDSKTPPACFTNVNEQKSIQPVTSDIGNSEESRRFKFSYQNFTKWCPKLPPLNPNGNSETIGKIKTNQIRPTTTAQNVSQPISVRVPRLGKLQINIQSDTERQTVATIATTQVAPDLHYSLRKLQNSQDLKKLEDVLDLIDRPHLDFSPVARFTYRTTARRKNLISRSRSPPLSPIRESGLSNPGSPRIDLVLPPSPVFVRPSTPETSIIFLSNPNSLSSSDDEQGDDEDDVVSHPNLVINKSYRTEDVLETPQLPRKAYSSNKGEQIFLTKSSRKKRPNKWINMAIKSDF